MREELKPCPFCGKQGALVRHYGFEANGNPMWSIECCSRREITKKGAVAAWNRRTPAPGDKAREALINAVVEQAKTVAMIVNNHIDDDLGQIAPDQLFGLLGAVNALRSIMGEAEPPSPMPLVLYCPQGHQHIDEGEWATRPHKTHQCQAVIPCTCPALYHGDCVKTICGLEWRPANVPTVGVKSLGEAEQV